MYCLWKRTTLFHRGALLIKDAAPGQGSTIFQGGLAQENASMFVVLVSKAKARATTSTLLAVIYAS